MLPAGGWLAGTSSAQSHSAGSVTPASHAAPPTVQVGDGTTSVVIVAAELLKRANELVRAKIHPTSIIGGYRLAMREVGAVHRCHGAQLPACGEVLIQAPAPVTSLLAAQRCRHLRGAERMHAAARG